MRERKYTLPRHTNLAKQGARTGAFFIDLAIALALTLGFFFGCFNLIFRSQTKPCAELIEKEELASGLYYKDKSTGEATRIPSSKDHEVFENALRKFYFDYLPGKTLSGDKTSQKNHDMKWFNINILECESTDEEAVYTYYKEADVIQYDHIGVPKEGVVSEEVGKFIQAKYEDAIIDYFNEINFVKEAGLKQMNLNALSFVLSALIGTSVGYVLLPWLLKNGQTLGKKLFKLGLADSDGYRFNNKQLIMRVMPLVVCELSLMLLVRVNMYLVISIFLIIFLVSFGVAMASPKKMALHDYTARSMVVDLKTSIIFDDPMEEEKYLLEEDHILEEGQEPVEYNGEEPELKYEK